MASIGKLDIDLRLMTQKFDAGMSRTNKKIDKFSRKMDKVTGLVSKATLGFGALAGAGGMFALVKSTIAANDALAKTADKIGLTTQELQEYQFAASQSAGVTEKSLNVAMQRFSRRMGEAVKGKGELLGILKQYGIAVTDSSGKTRNMNDVLADYADAIKGADSQQEKLRLAFKAFDTEGAALVNMMKNGSQGLENLAEQARNAGVVMDESLIRPSEELNSKIDAWSDTLKNKASVAITELVVGMADALHIIETTVPKIELQDGSYVSLKKAIDNASTAELDYIGASKQGRAEKEASIKSNIEAIRALANEQKAVMDLAFARANATRMAGLSSIDIISKGVNYWQSQFFESKGNRSYEEFKKSIETVNTLQEKLNNLGKPKKTTGPVFSSSGSTNKRSGGGKSAKQKETEALIKQSDLLFKKRSEITKALTMERLALQENKLLEYEYGLSSLEIGEKKLKLSESFIAASVKEKQQILAAAEASKIAKEKEQESEQKLQALMEEGKRLYEETRSPVEQLNAEFERFNTLLQAKAITQETYNRAIANTQSNFDELNKKAKESSEEFNKLDQSVLNWQDSFTGALMEGEEGLKSFFSTMLKQWAQAQAKMALFGKDGTSGLLGGLFAGGSTSAGASSSGFNWGTLVSGLAGARASGGPVSGGSSYLVGEKGPEIFSPSQSGSIIPNHRLGGSIGGVNLTVSPVISVDARSDATQVQQMVDQTVRSAGNEIIRQIIPIVKSESDAGGVFSKSVGRRR